MLRRVGINDTAQTELISQNRCSTSLYLALVFATSRIQNWYADFSIKESHLCIK